MDTSGYLAVFIYGPIHVYMIITCEKCTTSYSVADDALGAGGRKVKCKSCGHVWQQVGAGESGPEDSTETKQPEAEETPARKSGVRQSGGAVAMVALVLAVGGLAGAVYAGRAAIVGSWPPAALLYEEIGIGLHGIDLAGIPGVGAGLEYRNITSEIVTDAFGDTLWIRGEVLNASEIPRPVPKLRVSLADAHGAALESWTFSVEVDRLEPGAAAAFETSRRAETEAGGKLVLGVDGSWSEATTVESELAH